MKAVLITGGAGYIGSHMADLLYQYGYLPIVLDNLSSSFISSPVKEYPFFCGNAADGELIEKIYSQHRFSSVMHFAASIQVGESIINPLKYYENNVAVTINLLQTLRKIGVKHFIFSSSAAVYGNPLSDQPITEKHPTTPINSYGRSKLIIEEILKDCDLAYGLKYISLRYFNVGGINKKISVHPQYKDNTHIIPLALQAAIGELSHFTIHGNDYPTNDGTCIRDYLHVNDLCHAHLLALQFLQKNNLSAIYNLGIGKGYSVKQIINFVKEISQHEFLVIEGERRKGDPAILVADGKKAQSELNWKPKSSNLKKIISDNLEKISLLETV